MSYAWSYAFSKRLIVVQAVLCAPTFLRFRFANVVLETTVRFLSGSEVFFPPLRSDQAFPTFILSNRFVRFYIMI